MEILAKNLPGFSTVLIETLNKNFSWILGHNFSTFSKVVYLTHSLSFFPFSTIEHRSIFLWQLHVLKICDFCKGWMLRHCRKKNVYIGDSNQFHQSKPRCVFPLRIYRSGLLNIESFILKKGTMGKKPKYVLNIHKTFSLNQTKLAPVIRCLGTHNVFHK